MRSSDLILFREICDSLNDSLYQTLQNPDDEFIKEIEDGSKFSEYISNGVEYDFDEMENRLNVKLRYYQRLALYFTKYCFEKKYLVNDHQNNKLTYWMATGSGKTIIMKANIIDYFEYLKDKNPDEIEVIITSPLKELIGQLQKEMDEFFVSEFFKDFKFSYTIETTQALINKYENESHEIVGEKQYRLLLVDEAHIGLGKNEKGSFVNLRDSLTQNYTNSFMFEYSATFYDITNQKQKKEYANRIIYEYDYGKFYNDKYGKDFKFDVVKKDDIAEDEDKDIKRNLDANLETFNKKLDAFYKYNQKFKTKPFPNRPLLIMAGNTVSANKENSANNEENSDISKIISYLANLDDETINKYIHIFNENQGVLHLLQNSSNDGEILLSYGEDAKPFGLITIGNVKKFLENSNIQKLIADRKIISKNIKFVNENYLFKNIDFDSSPINILIGSRKFSAGWNSFRASQICLINFGTGSGPTIIQMFGRGVRLKGLNGDGKRQEKYYVKEEEIKKDFLPHSKDNITSKEKYDLLKYLETLFIYSLRSTYLSKFVEEDTDIYKKSITFQKSVKVSEDYKKEQLPIFYVDKKSTETQDTIKVNIAKKNDKLILNYFIDSQEKETFIKLPLTLNLTIQKEKTLDFDGIKWLKKFIDLSYVEKLIIKKESQNKLLINNLNTSCIIYLLKKKKIIIKYDGEIANPQQFQKLIIKVANTLISKIKNKIIYNETKQNYIFSKNITNDDYIDKYDIKFILDKNADTKAISQRLETVENFNIFIDKIVNHYYKPLSLNPHANSKPVFETYQKCLNKSYTENYNNVIHSDDKYFENIDEIKISPDKLEPYEFKFICDLQEYIQSNGLNAIVLRNKSKGNIGLIAEDGIFYPDFIIWYQDENNQKHIMFCDPKGIRNPETKWKVCNAPYEIKEIEKQWNEHSDLNIKLHSFIISNTKKDDIKWSPIDTLSLDACDIFYNLLFFEDSNYIERIFSGLNTDIELHRAFKENLEIYAKQEIIDEWINDEKREYHIEIIDRIAKEENLDIKHAMLLYFIIWDKQDKIKEKNKKSIQNEIGEHIATEILNDIVPEIIMDSIPYSRTVLKIYKYLNS